MGLDSSRHGLRKNRKPNRFAVNSRAWILLACVAWRKLQAVLLLHDRPAELLNADGLIICVETEETGRNMPRSIIKGHLE